MHNIHFTHPDHSGSPGLALSGDGQLRRVQGSAAIRESLIMLLTTIPGERVMRPAYGCHLDRLVFEVCDDTAAGMAIHYVRQAVRRWEPRVEVIGIDADADADRPGVMHLQLDYLVRDSGERDELRLQVQTGGAA